MIVTAYKTPLVSPGDDLFELLQKSIPNIAEGSVVCISSKIIALCQSDICSLDTNKVDLIAAECEWYIPSTLNPFGSTITITGGKLAAAAGIDESNVDNCLVLLPSHIQQTVQEIRGCLMSKFNLRTCGVLAVDSRSIPLNLGTVGQAIAYAGFEPLKDYRGTKDLYGRTMRISRSNIAQNLASLATLAMGEGQEQTPIVIAEDATMVTFSDSLIASDELTYEVDKDLYASLLVSDAWLSGGRSYLARQL